MKVNMRNVTPSLMVMAITGRLDAVTSPGFEKEIAAFFSGPARSLAVDLGQVDYVSSAGLRVILLAAKKAKEAGVKFALFGIQEPVLDVLRISGFASLLDILPNEADALTALGRAEEQ